MAPVALFMVIVSGYLFARLQSRERYGYSVTEALPALAIALLVRHPLGRRGSRGADPWHARRLSAAGPGARRHHRTRAIRLSARCAWRHRSAEWRSLYGAVLLMGLGQLLITATIPIDQGFAARLGEGAVATLGYANRIVTLFSGLATIVAGRAFCPCCPGRLPTAISRLGRRHALQWSGIAFGGAAIGSVILWAVTPRSSGCCFSAARSRPLLRRR